MSQQINLFNPIYLKQKKTFSAVHMVDAMAVLIVGVAGFYAYASIETLNYDRQSIETTRQYDQSKLRLAQASARYAPKKADAGLEAEVNRLQAQLSARQATVTNLGVGQLAAEAGYTEYMRALARQSVAGLWLTGFKISKGGTELEIVGRALQPDLVPSYIQRLNRERTLHGRAFDSLSMTQREGALPADTTRPAGAPAVYAYTEFRLGSSYVEPAGDGDVEPVAKVPPGSSAGILPGVPQPGQAAGAAPR